MKMWNYLQSFRQNHIISLSFSLVRIIGIKRCNLYNFLTLVYKEILPARFARSDFQRRQQCRGSVSVIKKTFGVPCICTHVLVVFFRKLEQFILPENRRNIRPIHVPRWHLAFFFTEYSPVRLCGHQISDFASRIFKWNENLCLAIYPHKLK